jgi:tetratricopeptide (TPR) repeat protein
VGDENFDVFISYGHQDTAWVHTLAENLHRAGLDVFLDKWEITPGDVVVHELERGLLGSRNGILVVSPASMARPWVQQEYAVMVGRAVEGTQRLIPVLLGDVEVPPFAATRLWVDFRGVHGPEYERRVRQLVATLRGERPTRPARDGGLSWPSSEFRPEGARRATLRINPDETVLEVEGEQVAAPPRGPSHRLEEQLWQVQRVRHGGPQSEVLPTAGQAARAATTMHGRLVDVGSSLAEAFLPDLVRARLVEQVRLATDQGAALRLAVGVTVPGLVDLPWEALCLPEVAAGPLVLHPRVEAYRAVSGLGPTTAMQIPGPLRILVVIGSPDQGDRGELLDYEAELRRILDAVEPARRRERAYVRILNRGTVAEMRAALKAQRFHVLHVSCHAQPGALVLEKEDGQPDLMSAERFAKEVLVPDRGVPLVVLAGCSTALTERAPQQPDWAPRQQGDEVQQGETALPGLARQLLGYGVPAVLAMNAPVTDTYAARLGARVYQELATQQRPDPLAAVSEARRQIDAELRMAPAGSSDARLAERAEWATPVLSVRGPSLPLFDPTEDFEELQTPPEPRLAPGIVVRGVGDFVGRRLEGRLLLAALRGRRAGVVIHGIGGVGKSTLAAQLVADLGEQAGLVVSVAGKVTVDQVVDETGRRLHLACLARNLEEGHPLRQLARLLREPKIPWTERLDLLADHLLRQQPVVLLLDNFEDNLQQASNGTHGFELADPQLAGFLTAWINARGMSRLLITSRHPFSLPNMADKRLEPHHLGPLSLAETRKLVWRLPGLDRLGPGQLQRAYADVGGHPRALEYLDALLRGGQARFDDITDRLEQALTARDIDDPEGWLAEVAGNLDRALAESITLAVNDVLLGQLLDRLDEMPLARRLLLGVSAYRVPVDDHGIAWQVAEEITQSADPQRQVRFHQLAEAVWAARDAGQEVTAELLGLSQAEFTDLVRELNEEPRPPLVAPAGLRDAVATLAELGLAVAAPSDGTAGRTRTMWVVHRWTAAALARLAAEPDLQEAHRRAARYWRWRAQGWPQDRQADNTDLLEARFHYLASGQMNEAADVTIQVCAQLFIWGAWTWVEQLCQDTLLLEGISPANVADLYTRLGVIAVERGDYRNALEWHRKSTSIREEIGDRHGLATSFHELGMVAHRQGDFDQAMDSYRKSLAISEELGHRQVMAGCFYQLGMLAFDRGNNDQALEWTRKAHSLSEELGDRAGIARARHELGNIAFRSGNYDQALVWYRRSLAIKEELGNRIGMAVSYAQLGVAARELQDYEKALDWTRKALSLCEELGDRSGMAHAYHGLGNVAFIVEDYKRALEWYRASLVISEQIGDRIGAANSYFQVGMVAQKQRDYEQALEWYRLALSIFQEIGDREGMATASSQLGNLHTVAGPPVDGVRWSLQALSMRVEIGSPKYRIDLHWLARQQELLGKTSFTDILHDHLNDEGVAAVLEMLEGASGQDDAGPGLE